MLKGLLFLMMGCYLFAHPLIIYTENNPPWNYKDENKLAGISTEIVQLIQKDINNNNEIKLIPWNRAYEKTLKNKNHLLFTTAKIKQREELFHWIGPIAVDRVFLFKHKNSTFNIKNLEDAKRVTTIDAGPITNATYMVLKNKGFENLSTLSREIANINGLVRNRVDLLALGEYAFRYKIHKEGFDIEDFENTGLLIFEYPLYIAFSKNTDKSIVQKWQNSFNKLKEKGTIDKIINRKLKELEK